MELAQLKIFKDVAHEKSFVKAARLNYLTQPSISSRIKQLEEELGIRLFERAPRNVRLTKEGALLLPYVEDVLVKCENIKVLSEQSKRSPVGHLRIASVYSIGMYELDATLREFLRNYPDIQVHLRYQRSDLIYDLVLKNEIDLGLVAYPVAHPRLTVTCFSEDSLVIIVPNNHSLAGKEKLVLESIADYNFIAFSKEIGTGKALNEILLERGIEVSVRMSNDNIDTVKRAVEAGLGISIVPSKSVEDELREGTLKKIEISNCKIKRPLGIITLKDRVLSYPEELFVEMLKTKSS